ncbi:hypothetical protein VNO77_05356 [Canavalia gladiata]|uniref:Uncharacterized protein n=1 Tax=Canavalia gladiata TaxID=3824 RepID=A0AAN9N3C4_CANGL
MEGTDYSLVPQWLKSSGNVSRVASINSQLTSSPYSGNCLCFIILLILVVDGTKVPASQGHIVALREAGMIETGRKILTFSFIRTSCFLCSQSMNSERWRESWSPRTSGDVSNPKRNYMKSDDLVTGVADVVHKSVLDEEFPLLGAEDKHDSSELRRVLSSSSSTATSPHNLLPGTSVMTVSNGLTSAPQDIPVVVGSSSMAMMMRQHNVSTSTSSIALGTMSLSMAETLAQGSPRSNSPPQLSASAQKLEELALKQSRLLIPMTPTTPRSLVKTGQQQHPFSYSRRPSHSLHGAHLNSDIQKINSGNSHNVIASRELNGVPSVAKDNLSPNSRVVLNPPGATTTSTSTSASSRGSSNNSTPSAWITLEKRSTFPTQSRNDFFKNLSRKNSLKKPCSDVFPIGMSCTLEKSEASTRTVTSCPMLKSRDTPSVGTFSVNLLTDCSSIITENDNAASEPLKLSSNGDQQHSTNLVPYQDDKEIAFLRSLGWEESAGDDEGLTEEEIRDFYEKYMKLQL